MNIKLTLDSIKTVPFNWYRQSGTELYHAHPSHNESGEGDNSKSLCGRRWTGSSWDDAYIGNSSFNLPHCDECERVGLMMQLAE